MPCWQQTLPIQTQSLEKINIFATSRHTNKHTDRQTHQYHDSAWPRGRAEWRKQTLAVVGQLSKGLAELATGPVMEASFPRAGWSSCWPCCGGDWMTSFPTAGGARPRMEGTGWHPSQRLAVLDLVWRRQDDILYRGRCCWLLGLFWRGLEDIFPTGWQLNHQHHFQGGQRHERSLLVSFSVSVVVIQ